MSYIWNGPKLKDKLISYVLDISDYKRIPDLDQKNLKIIRNSDKIQISWGNTFINGTPDNRLKKYGLFKDKTVEYFHLDFWAGGRFIIYENNIAELTIYGSGLPIVSSKLGILIPTN